MKIVIGIALIILLTFLVFQIFSFIKQNAQAKKVLESSKENYARVMGDAKKLGEDLKYYSNPINLEKELRARFNYRSPDESLIIIVPESSSTKASSTR